MHFFVVAFLFFALSRLPDSNGAESGAHKGARKRMTIFQVTSYVAIY